MDKIIIAHNSDLEIDVRVLKVLQGGGGESKAVSERATFKVHKQSLYQGSEVLAAHIDHAPAEGNISLTDDSLTSMRIVFEALHDQEHGYEVGLEQVWYVIAACDKYRIPLDKIKTWFVSWYQRQPIKSWFLDWTPQKNQHQHLNTDPRCLLFPTWRFDYADGFFQVTRFLVYHSEFHVTEANPIKRWDMRMPSRITREST